MHMKTIPDNRRCCRPKAAVLFRTVLLFAAAVPAAANPTVDVRFSGSVKSAAGAYIYGKENAGHLSAAKTVAAAAVDAAAGGGTLFVAADVSLDALKTDAADGITGTLREAYFSWTGTPFALRAGNGGLQAGITVGRQIHAWGKADGKRIADVLCPQDLTTLSAADYRESRLGVDAVKATISGAYFAADAYWIPVFRPSALPLENGSALASALVPKTVSLGATALPVTVGDIRKPEAALENGSYAARVGFWLPAVDFSIYGYYGYDDTPVLSYAIESDGGSPTGIGVSGTYHRYAMAGADAAVPLGSFVLRAEAAFFCGRAFALDPAAALSGAAGETTYLRKNQLAALAGVDWSYGTWTVTAQYYEDVVFGTAAALGRKTRENGATLNVSGSFLQNTLTVSLSGAVAWNDLDSCASIAADYALSDQITLTLAAAGYFPGPESDGTYGVYKNMSSVRIEGIYRF